MIEISNRHDSFLSASGKLPEREGLVIPANSQARRLALTIA